MGEILKELPAVILRGSVLLPGVVSHFDISTQRSIHAVEAAMNDDNHIFLVTQKDMQTEHAKQEDVYTIGVVAEIKQIVKMPMCNRACFPVERHKPGCVAPFQRRLRNQFFRQIIVKVMCFQQIQPFLIC